MFFSNLEQMKRQCETLLEMDQDEIESILEDSEFLMESADKVLEKLDKITDGKNTYTPIVSPNSGAIIDVTPLNNPICAFKLSPENTPVLNKLPSILFG